MFYKLLHEYITLPIAYEDFGLLTVGAIGVGVGVGVH